MRELRTDAVGRDRQGQTRGLVTTPKAPLGRKIITQRPKEKPVIGYHYCSLESFLSILQTKSLFMSDPLKMNDCQELTWFIRLLQEYDIKEEYLSVLNNRAGDSFTYSSLLKCLENQGQNNIFIACFSTEKDLLSQWRAYANDGQGVAIGFDLDKLSLPDNICYSKVTYLQKNDALSDYISNMVESESDLEIGADQASVITRYRATDPIKTLIYEFIPSLAKHKNYAFHEESEIRLIYSHDTPFEDILSDHHAFYEPYNPIRLEVKYRTRESSIIVEYVQLPICPMLKPIKKICLGPKCRLKATETNRIIESLLGYSLDEKDITRSTASYV